MTQQSDPGLDNKRKLFNITAVTFAVQSGCAAVVVVGIFLGMGLWLDAQFNDRHWFTFGLLLISIPVSLLTMLSIARLAISRIKTDPGTSRGKSSEEAGIGKNS